MIPWLVSTCVSTLSSTAGSTKLGQPEPESNFTVRAKQLRAAAGAAVHACVLHVGVRTRERPLGALLPQHRVLLRGEPGAPLRVGQHHFRFPLMTVRPPHPRDRYTTTKAATAANWVAAAATTSTWKTSWKPNVRGNGFGQWNA